MEIKRPVEVRAGDVPGARFCLVDADGEPVSPWDAAAALNAAAPDVRLAEIAARNEALLSRIEAQAQGTDIEALTALALAAYQRAFGPTLQHGDGVKAAVCAVAAALRRPAPSLAVLIDTVMQAAPRVTADEARAIAAAEAAKLTGEGGAS
jgi:hypothetical protein